jgi:hypothetical protein
MMVHNIGCRNYSGSRVVDIGVQVETIARVNNPRIDVDDKIEIEKNEEASGRPVLTDGGNDAVF